MEIFTPVISSNRSKSILNILFYIFYVLDVMITEMRKVFNIPSEKEVRLWGIYSGTTFEKFTETCKSIQECSFIIC